MARQAQDATSFLAFLDVVSRSRAESAELQRERAFTLGLEQWRKETESTTQLTNNAIGQLQAQIDAAKKQEAEMLAKFGELQAISQSVGKAEATPSEDIHRIINTDASNLYNRFTDIQTYKKQAGAMLGNLQSQATLLQERVGQLQDVHNRYQRGYKEEGLAMEMSQLGKYQEGEQGIAAMLLSQESAEQVYQQMVDKGQIDPTVAKDPLFKRGMIARSMELSQGLLEPELKNRELNIKASEATSIKPFDQFKAMLDLQDRSMKMAASYETMQDNMLNIEASVNRMMVNEGKEKNRIATDQAVIMSYQKILDPTSVVRESEYERTPGDEAVLRRAEGALAKIGSGGAGISKKSIIEIRDTAREMMELKRKVLEFKRDQLIRDPARMVGVPVSMVAPEFKSTTDIVIQYKGAGYDTPTGGAAVEDTDLDGWLNTNGLEE